ncbi:2-amino-4-hydroxy-6-hydroxymethyldihydropteridine diphosphokinase [Marinicella sp. W31]|uniref:2-amino-4-hydroxy-6- hydroxymethyldihydropteridine diphosphokinase n=1 Tax=Marinicella sp. W31 TaxID=3023713 RepID=UPI003757136F
MNTHCVYLGLGSNLGDSRLEIKTALIHLDSLPDTSIEAISQLYQSKPWGKVTHQPDYLNAVAELKTSLEPLTLLQHIKHIEYQLMGRVETERWHQRIIDIDILFYDDMQIDHATLKIPHPHALERCFVLQPLLDLALKLKKDTVNNIKRHHQGLKCAEDLQCLGAL